MDTITRAQLISRLRERKGTELVTLKTETTPKLKKNPLGCIVKHCTLNVMIGFDYENSVNNQRGREESEMDFIAKPRRWGRRVDLKSVEHKGQVYVTANCLKVYGVFYTVDGLKVESSLLDPYQPKKATPKQGIEKTVIYRDYKLDSITGINFRGIKATVIS